VFELPSADMKPAFIKKLEKHLTAKDLYANISLKEITVILAGAPAKSRADLFSSWNGWLSQWKTVRGALGEQASA
jgi:carbohydrate diacid regulator